MKIQPKNKPTIDNGQSQVDDAVWGALSDTSRRHILDLLRVNPMTTSELSSHFDFSRFAVMKHLKCLEKAGMVIVERRGRERVNHLNPIPIQSIYRRWISPFEALPADRLLRLKLVAELSQETRNE
jgi:DNA-binding transcriptional ArsR family regulator